MKESQARSVVERYDRLYHQYGEEIIGGTSSEFAPSRQALTTMCNTVEDVFGGDYLERLDIAMQHRHTFMTPTCLQCNHELPLPMPDDLEPDPVGLTVANLHEVITCGLEDEGKSPDTRVMIQTVDDALYLVDGIDFEDDLVIHVGNRA